MTFRSLAALKILVCAAGGTAFLPSFMWLGGVILPSDDKVGVKDIPALASMGVVYGLVFGILWVYRHKMEQNRMVRVFLCYRLRARRSVRLYLWNFDRL